jgi:hypothetical protein
MSSLRLNEIRPMSVVRPGTALSRGLRYAAMALGVIVLCGGGEVRPAAAQDFGRIIGGAISGGIRGGLGIRERHRETRRTKGKNSESSAKEKEKEKEKEKADNKPVGDGKTFGSKADDDSKVQTTKVGDGGSPKGQSSSPDGGNRSRESEKGPAPSEKPQGEAPNFTAR